MSVAAIREDVVYLELLLREFVDRADEPEDLPSDEDLSDRVPLAERAGIADEAAAALNALLDAYESGDEAAREEVRQTFIAHEFFSGGVPLKGEWTSPAAEFRRKLVHCSALDRADDPRDKLVEIWTLCFSADSSGVAIEPIVEEVAGMSGDTDVWGFGSTRFLIMRGLERDNWPPSALGYPVP